MACRHRQDVEIIITNINCYIGIVENFVVLNHE